MIDAGLIVARLLHYVAVTALAGTSLFPLYAYRRGSGPPPNLQNVLFIAANFALFSGILWFVFAVANMSGTLDGVLDREMLSTVLGDTSFGKVWIARLILTIVILVVIWNRSDFKSGPPSSVIVPLLAATLLISLAGVGHSQVEEGIACAVHVVSDAGHLFAAGVWLGGLVPLVLILSTDLRSREVSAPADLDEVLMRFSGMDYFAVATLAGTGLVNSWYLVGNVTALPTTQYGQLLLGKLALFAGMLSLAAINRFRLVPVMRKANADGGGSSWKGRLRVHVIGEQILGLLVLSIVSVLGTFRPAVGQ
jgi:copper resistance protein D